MCNCIELTNEALAVYGIRLQQNIIWGNNEMKLSGMIVATEKLNKVPRGVKVPTLFASFCPICGADYNKESVDDGQQQETRAAVNG